MNKAIVIILFDQPHEHTADYAKQTAIYFSKNNFVLGVLQKDAISIKEIIFHPRSFIFFKKINLHYYIYQPVYVLPFRRFQTIVSLNLLLNALLIRLIIEAISFRNKLIKKYIWIFNPISYPLFRYLGSSYISLYDCVDYHGEEETGVFEKPLIKLVDYMFVNSKTLFDIHHTKRQDIHIVPLGFDEQTFAKKNNLKIVNIPKNRPIIGYIGGLNSRLDFDLLSDLIKRNPQYTFVFVGPVQMHEIQKDFILHTKPVIDSLFLYKNAIHIPFVTKTQIPEIVRQFTICIIPYDVKSGFNKYCYPMKLLEYFYMGKPVISTPIDELKQFIPYIRIGKDLNEWEQNIQELVSTPWPSIFKNEQKTIARNNNWNHKISMIMNLVME